MAVISGGKIIEGAQSRVGSPTVESSAGVPSVAGGLRWARGRYSFATDGGAVGTINLIGSAVIPANAVVREAFISVVTVPTSAGAATIALQVESAGDLQAAAAISGAPWSTTGVKNLTPFFRTTVARDIAAVVATAALTAGVFDVFVGYVETA